MNRIEIDKAAAKAEKFIEYLPRHQKKYHSNYLKIADKEFNPNLMIHRKANHDLKEAKRLH